jgi:hypothetical protein
VDQGRTNKARHSLFVVICETLTELSACYSLPAFSHDQRCVPVPLMLPLHCADLRATCMKLCEVNVDSCCLLVNAPVLPGSSQGISFCLQGQGGRRRGA